MRLRNFNGTRTFGKGNAIVVGEFYSGLRKLILTSDYDYVGRKSSFNKILFHHNVCIVKKARLGLCVMVFAGFKVA